MRITVMRINAGPFQTATVGSLIRITHICPRVYLGFGWCARVDVTRQCELFFVTTRIIMRFVRSRLMRIQIWTSVDRP